MRVCTQQLAPRGKDTVGNVDNFFFMMRQLARALARMPGFTESLALIGEPSSGKEFILTALAGLVGTSLDSPPGYIQSLESACLNQEARKGQIQAFESQLEGARFALISEASKKPINVAVYKGLCEGGTEITARAGYECRRTDQLTLQTRAMPLLSANKHPVVEHSADSVDKKAAQFRWGAIQYSEELIPIKVHRVGEFKSSFPVGSWNMSCLRASVPPMSDFFKRQN